MEFNEELQKLKEEFEKKMKQLESKYSNTEIKCRKVSDTVLDKESFLSTKWHLKDEVDIPVGDRVITFVVEHVSKDVAHILFLKILCAIYHTMKLMIILMAYLKSSPFGYKKSVNTFAMKTNAEHIDVSCLCYHRQMSVVNTKTNVRV